MACCVAILIKEQFRQETLDEQEDEDVTIVKVSKLDESSRLFHLNRRHHHLQVQTARSPRERPPYSD